MLEPVLARDCSNKIGEVIGIFKAYCTRVGSGPFLWIIWWNWRKIRKSSNEFGATTEDLEDVDGLIYQPKYAININGVTQLNMMKWMFFQD